MLVWLFQQLFGKVIGLDRIPKESRHEAAKIGLDAALKAVEAFAKGAAKGTAEGIKNDS